MQTLTVTSKRKIGNLKSYGEGLSDGNYVENSSIYAIRPALPLVETLKQRVHQHTTP